MAKKYSGGEEITRVLSASGLNRATDAAEFYANYKSLGQGIVTPRMPDLGVKFLNTSGEVIPPYGVMEVTGIQSMNRQPPIYLVGKPGVRRDGQMWLVNKYAPAAPSATLIHYGTWATEPTPVMTQGTKAVSANFSPIVNGWHLVNDPYSADGYTGLPTQDTFGFQAAAWQLSGSPAWFPQNTMSDYTYAYDSGSSALVYGIFQQVRESNVFGSGFTLSAENNSGWTTSSSRTINAGGTGYYSCSATANAIRSGLAGTGSSTPGADGTLVQGRVYGHYRFGMYVGFSLAASAGDYSGSYYRTFTTSAEALVNHKHGGGADPDTNPTQTHTVSVFNGELVAAGPSVQIGVSGGVILSGTIYSQTYPLVQQNTSRSHSLFVEWEETLSGVGDTITISISMSDSSAKHTLVSNAPRLYVTRLRNFAVMD